MADGDLEAIRARRMAELQAQYGEVRKIRNHDTICLISTSGLLD